eukprot:gene7067-14379_t
MLKPFLDEHERKRKIKHRVCMVSDFFYPNMGGVEMHIWCLSQCLLQRGHKVIVVTHAYNNRKGIRYMTNGLKVYYLPLTVFYDQISFPTLYAFFPLFRNILIRERITIVHGHQSTSSLTNECILYARTMRYRVVYTDHSLFGFDDAASRENLVLRATIHPSHVSTIPNAVDPSKFTPDTSRRYPTNTINVVMLSRLVYRKGIDLVARVIPLICEKFPNVYFIIGGDGPKKLLLEEMRENFQLHDRMELLGAVPHHRVRDVLVRGHIFLNCSLTESFCIALLEAASCGLFVVSTKVGGVPEVLPPSMIKFAEPNALSLFHALVEAMSVCRRVVPSEFHSRVRQMYSWHDVACRTEVVYDNVEMVVVDADMELEMGIDGKGNVRRSEDDNNDDYNGVRRKRRLCLHGSGRRRKFPSLGTRFLRYLSVGPWAGPAACFIVACLHILWRICDYIWPAKDIEICPDFGMISTSAKCESNRVDHSYN